MHERAVQALEQERAVVEIDAAITGRWAGVRRLSSQELKERFPERSFAFAWLLPGETLGISRDLIVGAGDLFPQELPRVGLAIAPPIAALPHVEADGVFCVVPPGSLVILPVDIRHVAYLVEDSVKVLRAGLTGENRVDFLDESATYWTLDASRTGVEHWLASPPPSSSREMVAAKLGEIFVIADSKTAMATWMEGRGQKMPNKLLRGVFLSLDAPLYPQDYPHDVAGLRLLAERAGPDALRILEGMTRPGSQISIVIAFEHEGRRLLLGARVDVPRSIPGPYKKRVPIWLGFREDSVPGDRVLQMMAGARTALQRCSVVEVHRRALVARTTGAVSRGVANGAVAVIGCGSLGGAVALLLAQSGVARLRLIDPETLSWQNVGRHVLPGAFVGQRKAKALARHLRSYLPDLEVDAIDSRWETAWKEDPDVFDGVDIIVSATGEWASEAFLNELSKQGLEVPPVVFGWLEAYGLAGHSVLVFPRGGCLRCVTTEHGEFTANVAEFEHKPLMREAACGVAFQPFGAVTVMPVASMVANVALDALRGESNVSEHRTWIGARHSFDKVNATITKTWFERVNPDGFERIHRMTLTSQRECPHCGKA